MSSYNWMGRIFNVVVQQGLDGYLIAEAVELPGCRTQAKTHDELLKRIKEAIELYLKENKPDDASPKFLSLQQVEVEVS